MAKKKKKVTKKKEKLAPAPREYPLRPIVEVETSLGAFALEFLIDSAPVAARVHRCHQYRAPSMPGR